jgi:hypothetical protein
MQRITVHFSHTFFSGVLGGVARWLGGVRIPHESSTRLLPDIFQIRTYQWGSCGTHQDAEL